MNQLDSGARIPPSARQAALFPEFDLPDPPPGHPYRVIRRDGLVVGSFPGKAIGDVYVQALPVSTLRETIDEVRQLLSDDGKSEGAWIVPRAARPEGLSEALMGHGMIPCDRPPFEPQFAAMAAVVPPARSSRVIETRLAGSFEEFRAAQRITDAAFHMSEEDIVAHEAKEADIWAVESAGGASRTFVAVVAGEVIGTARALYGASSLHLAGGSTRPDLRGWGVYRSLVRARWDAAVERGTPTLTVSAGRLSLPILQRLNFVTVGQVDCLLDRFA